MSRRDAGAIPVEAAAAGAGPTTCVDAEPYALRVTDASMAPELPKGCLIVVDPSVEPRDGQFVVADHPDGLVVRRLRIDGARCSLEAEDPAVAPLALPGGTASVRGVVVQRAGRRRREHKRFD